MTGDVTIPDEARERESEAQLMAWAESDAPTMGTGMPVLRGDAARDDPENRALLRRIANSDRPPLSPDLASGRSRYTVMVERGTDTWVLQCREYPAALSEVTRMDHADIIREAIAFVAGVPEESVEYDLVPAPEAQVIENLTEIPRRNPTRETS